MKPPLYYEAKSYLRELALAQEFLPARAIHKRLEIRMPYGLWAYSQIVARHGTTQPDDYFKVGKEYQVSPILALMIACGGGSNFSAMCQVVQVEAITDAIGDRNPIEVIDTAIKVQTANEFLARELDPEREASND